jgi:light-regulated signal transduction histidine kinase (bacteriophytochrome)
VRAASQRMADLIDDMLQLSRISRSEMDCEAVDISVQVHLIIEELRRIEPERVVEVVIQDNLIASGDPKLIHVALENLIGNAWKFTSKRNDARIEFGISLTDDTTAYFVRDNGAGFDMAYVDKLFVPFQRLHAYTDFSGTGIGLSIVQRIIHRHGGEIWATGILDQGATIYFTLENSQRENAHD